MDRRTRRKTRQILTILSLVWLAGVGWVAFGRIPPDEVLTPNSPEVHERMRDECAGNFQERYDCKESIIVQTSQSTFANLSLRLAFVVLGPLAAAAGFAAFCRPDPEAPRPTEEVDMSWKTAAQRHIARNPFPPHHHDDHTAGNINGMRA